MRMTTTFWKASRDELNSVSIIVNQGNQRNQRIKEISEREKMIQVASPGRGVKRG